MLDVLVLAKETVAFLAPFLPYLIKGGEAFAEEAGKKLGEQASGGVWETAKTLWNRLQPSLESKGVANEAVQEVATNPNDEDTRAALRVQLRKLFAEDESLAKDVLTIQQEAKRAGVNVQAIGERNVAIGGSAVSSTIITGDKNKT